MDPDSDDTDGLVCTPYQVMRLAAWLPTTTLPSPPLHLVCFPPCATEHSICFVQWWVVSECLQCWHLVLGAGMYVLGAGTWCLALVVGTGRCLHYRVPFLARQG